MTTELKLMRYQVERARMASVDLYEWYRNNNSDPPTYLLLDLIPLVDVDTQIESLAKKLLGVSEIPAGVWSPFWGTHANNSYKYTTVTDYWGAAIKYSERTIVFLDFLDHEDGNALDLNA